MIDSNETPSARSAITIDLDGAVALDLPRPSLLRPSHFGGSNGRSGWVVGVSRDRPVATPAYENGRLFIGGGFGSHEFYSFNAESGELIWKIHTHDDGPTAAVVERGLVAFNTESCTVIVCDAATGRVVWQRWLGDPLLSQPAIGGDRLFIAYPTGRERPLIKVDMPANQTTCRAGGRARQPGPRCSPASPDLHELAYRRAAVGAGDRR